MAEAEPKRDEGARDLHAEGATLIRAAFEGARASGRADWERMTLAVLKNRILGLTERSFDEARWEARSFREFVGLFPEVVSVDPSTRPATAELIEGPPTSGAQAPTPPPGAAVMTPERRVRPDLWRAVLDYSSGRIYAWDGELAVPIKPESAPADDRARLPTIGPDDLAEWRTRFAAEHGTGTPANVSAALEAWRLGGLSTTTLPAPLHRLWNGELKRNVVERLDEWFRSAGIEAPQNMVETRRPASVRDDDTQRLRNLVVRCVEAMSHAELEELRISPAVLLRARG